MKIIIIAEDDDPTGELDRARASFRGEGFGEPEIYSIQRSPDRMNILQLLKLWRMCGDYGVSFNEDDYIGPFESGSIIPRGYVEGWVGGQDHSGTMVPEGRKKTIYVGVAPDGSSHT